MQLHFEPAMVSPFVIEAAKPFVVKYKEGLTVSQVNTLSGLGAGRLQPHVLQ